MHVSLTRTNMTASCWQPGWLLTGISLQVLNSNNLRRCRVCWSRSYQLTLAVKLIWHLTVRLLQSVRPLLVNLPSFSCIYALIGRAFLIFFQPGVLEQTDDDDVCARATFTSGASWKERAAYFLHRPTLRCGMWNEKTEGGAVVASTRTSSPACWRPAVAGGRPRIRDAASSAPVGEFFF